MNIFILLSFLTFGFAVVEPHVNTELVKRMFPYQSPMDQRFIRPNVNSDQVARRNFGADIDRVPVRVVRPDENSDQQEFSIDVDRVPAHRVPGHRPDVNSDLNEFIIDVEGVPVDRVPGHRTDLNGDLHEFSIDVDRVPVNRVPGHRPDVNSDLHEFTIDVDRVPARVYRPDVFLEHVKRLRDQRTNFGDVHRVHALGSNVNQARWANSDLSQRAAGAKSNEVDYLGTIKNWKTSFDAISRMTKSAHQNGKDEATYFSMLLNAVVQMGLDTSNNHDYNADYLTVSVKAMKDVLDDPGKFSQTVQNNYDKAFRERVQLIVDLEKHLCTPFEFFCNQVIDLYYKYGVPLLDSATQKRYNNAKAVLFTVSKAFDSVLKPSNAVSLLEISKYNQPVIWYLSNPDHMRETVKAIAEAARNLK